MNRHMIICIICQAIILLSIFCFENSLRKEIKESRVREDLLLTEMKLLDYQIDVLTQNFIEK